METFLDWRKIYAPHLRRTKPTAIYSNGSRQTLFNCICGSIHSASTEWRGREAKHVLDWRRQHDRGCNPVPAAIELENKRQLIYNKDH